MSIGSLQAREFLRSIVRGSDDARPSSLIRDTSIGDVVSSRSVRAIEPVLAIFILAHSSVHASGRLDLEAA